MTRSSYACALVGVTVLLVLALGASAHAATRNYWVAAVPTNWNVVPTETDALGHMTFDPASTVFPTVVYRRYSRGWRKPLANAPRSATDGGLIPGPLLHARA